VTSCRCVALRVRGHVVVRDSAGVPEAADDVALGLMSVRAILDVLLFVAVWCSSRHRPRLQHGRLTSAGESASAVAAWRAGNHAAAGYEARVHVGPRADQRSFADASSSPKTRAQATLLSPANGVTASVRPLVLDVLYAMKGVSPWRLCWYGAPSVIAGPNFLTDLHTIGACLISIFNSLATVFLATELSGILATSVQIINGEALPADRFDLTGRVIFFIAVSLGNFACQYVVGLTTAAPPAPDGTIAVRFDGMPCNDPNRQWIASIYPTFVALAVLVVLAAASVLLFFAAFVFIAVVVGMQLSLEMSGNTPQPPWWIATRFTGSIVVYPPLAYSQAVSAMNVIALGTLALVLVKSGNSSALAMDGDSLRSSSLRLLFLLRAFGTAVNAGVARNFAKLFMRFRRHLLTRRHAKMAKLRLATHAGTGDGGEDGGDLEPTHAVESPLRSPEGSFSSTLSEVNDVDDLFLTERSKAAKKRPKYVARSALHRQEDAATELNDSTLQQQQRRSSGGGSPPPAADHSDSEDSVRG
jgi:hypothetical protein